MRCKNCKEEVLKSDICGDYCVHCLDFEELVNNKAVPIKGQDKVGGSKDE